MGASWGIIGSAIGHSLSVMGTCGGLSKEVPMDPWLCVVVGTCDHSSMVVMGPCCRSSIMVVGGWSWPFINPGGGHSSMGVVGSGGHLLILVMGTVEISHTKGLVIVHRTWRWVFVANCRWSWWALVVFHGGCEKRGVAMCDIAFITSPHWDASNGVAHTFDSVDDGPYPLCWECVAVRISSQLISISDYKI